MDVVGVLVLAGWLLIAAYLVAKEKFRLTEVQRALIPLAGLLCFTAAAVLERSFWMGVIDAGLLAYSAWTIWDEHQRNKKDKEGEG